MIAEGRMIIIVDDKVLKVDSWLRYHPGGEKTIMHMVGRDATDEVNAYAQAPRSGCMTADLFRTSLHSAGARDDMKKFQIGQIKGRWENFLPPIQGGNFRRIIKAPEVNSDDELDTTSSSQNSTPPASPTFDPAYSQRGRNIRRRQSNTIDFGETSSISSMSSFELTSPKSSRKLSHMDLYTQESIDLDLSKYPPLDIATQDNIILKYRQLYKRIQSEGLFVCNYTAYLVESCQYATLFALFSLALRARWFGMSGMFLGMLWHQLVFTCHDAGHMGITHDFQTDTTIGIFLADFIGGLSLGWWKRSHNVHHIVTNSPEHDPDIEHMPFFAISHRFFDSLRSTYYNRVMSYDAMARFMVRYQHYLYYPVLLLGRFNLYRLSWIFLIVGQGPRKGPARWHRWLEIVGQIFFWYWFGYLVVYKSIPTPAARWAFVLISHMVTAPLHVQITLSHFAMSTADLGITESFPQKMLRTTMDVNCPQWLDFIHGGLQFQAIHHLFPRIPRHNLRRTQKLVQEFCCEVGIPYALYGFVDGNKEVIGKLADVGRQAAILAECQKVIAQRGDQGLH